MHVYHRSLIKLRWPLSKCLYDTPSVVFLLKPLKYLINVSVYLFSLVTGY